jgi:hypothetical protein
MSNREPGNTRFISEIAGSLFAPRATFKSIMEKPRLMKATALIIVIGVVATLASFNYTGTVPFLSVVGTWLISSALIHGLSSRLGGTGTLRSMLSLAGYASTPLLIQHLLRFIDSFIASPEALLQFTTTFQIFSSPLPNALVNAVLDVFNIFSIWSILLHVIATRENYNMSTRRSTVATLVSTIAVVIISAFRYA